MELTNTSAYRKKVQTKDLIQNKSKFITEEFLVTH
jgi:hypothetical protein